MKRSSRTDQATVSQPFLVRHLPLILTLLFLTALHQPLTKGLAPQIDYVTALLADDPTVQIRFAMPTARALNTGDMLIKHGSQRPHLIDI